MLLKNFWEARRVCNNNVIPYDGSYTAPHGDVVDITDLSGTRMNYLVNGKFTNYSITPYRTGVLNLVNPFKSVVAHIGTGTTPVTMDDYALENDVTNDFTSRTLSINKITNESGHYQIDCLWSGINNTDSDITITEFGLDQAMFRKDGKLDDTTSGTMVGVLIARHILTEPVTVAAHNGVSMVIRIEMQ